MAQVSNSETKKKRNYYRPKKQKNAEKTAVKENKTAQPKKGSIHAGNQAVNRPNKAAAEHAAQKRLPPTEPAAKFEPKKSAHRSKAPRRDPRKQSGSPLRVIPLGGLDEIGKNITAYEYGKDIILVDCGMSFPDEDMPGIDCVIPDFSWLAQNADRVRGLFVTHGHEDHIGGIPYLLKTLNIPVYGTPLTLGLIKGKLKEHHLLESAKLNEVRPRDTVRVGAFSVEFIHVNHSIPDAVAFAITCPCGTVVQTGDYKIDTTPIDGDMIDLARFGELGKEGVLALLSDSTNAERPGYTPSERVVGGSFANLFGKAEGKRIIVATFSSNIHRMQQIIDQAVRFGRKVAVSGRSMLNAVLVASELGYLCVPDGVLVDIEAIKKYSPEQLVVITTGSQGEPMSALHRMAFSDHRQVTVTPGDLIIISANPIPGNEKLVDKVVNELLKLGAEVIYEKMYEVHVSGHACQEEQKLIMGLLKPKYFIPVHGERKHLVRHAETAIEMGIPKENTLIPKNGMVIEVSNAGMKEVGAVTAGRVMVDGLGVGDVGSIVLRDRKHLSEDGVVVIALSMDAVTREVVSGPEVISRGFVYVKESEQLLADATEVACDVLEQCYLSGTKDWNNIKNRLRDGVAKFISERTGRSPMIIPIIMNV